MLFPHAFPSSTDVPVLLLNQPNVMTWSPSMTSCATLARLKVFISCHIMALVRYSVIREIWVNAASVFPMPAAKDLGVTIDSELQLDKLVNNKGD